MKLLRRREVVKALLVERKDLLVVAGLGSTSWDCTAAGDSPLTFPMWGAMGAAAMVGLGLALAQPSRRVLVITGDGEMLMGLGSLATIGARRPRNLAVVVIDNERYGETGMQETHTARGVNLAKAGLACGFRASTLLTRPGQIAALRKMIYGGTGPVLAQVKVAPERLPLVLPPREGVLLKNRFRRALLGTASELD
jgi:thiamine pyrophosphate-dependent acetolactate synthase large subunit-like protein